MILSLAPTRPTVMDNVHTVSMGSAVSSNFTCMSLIHPLGVCLTLSFHWYPGPLLYPVFACWSLWVNAATDAVRLVIVFHCNIIASMSAAAAVAILMRALCVPSISLRLLASWYPSARVDTFCFLLYFRCAAWKCAWKFAQIFSLCCLSSHYSQLS